MLVIHTTTKCQHFKEKRREERENRIKVSNEKVNQLNVGSFCEHCVIDLNYSENTNNNKKQQQHIFDRYIIIIAIEQKQCKFEYCIEITRRYTDIQEFYKPNAVDIAYYVFPNKSINFYI